MHGLFKKILFNTYRRLWTQKRRYVLFFSKKKEKEKQITNFLIKIYISAFLCPQTPVCVRGKEGGKRAPNFAAFLLGVF